MLCWYVGEVKSKSHSNIRYILNYSYKFDIYTHNWKPGGAG